MFQIISGTSKTVSGTQNVERNVPNTAHTNVPTNSGTLFLLVFSVQHLLANFVVVSNNMCEGNNSRIKSNGQRSMAPVDHILSFLRDMVSVFTTRHAIALSYQSIYRAAVCPDVTAKTLYGADLLHKQR